MNDRTNQVIGGVIVIILIIGAWYVGQKQLIPVGGENTTPADSVGADTSSDSDVSDTVISDESTGTDNTATTPSVRASGESITVADQPAGMQVKIASVTLPELGWVAVRDNNGRVLGAGRFDAGTNNNVAVELLRGTVAGEKYQVLLYIDDGDMQYDLHKDSLVMNADASVAGTMFSAQ